MKSFRSILAAALWFGLSPCVGAALVDGIKVVVHDSVITKSDVEDFALPAVEEIERQFRTQPAIRNQRVEQALEESVERLVDNRLILREFESAGYNLPESIIDQYVQERIRSVYVDRVRLIKTLQQQGLTYEQFRRRMRDDLIVTQMRLSKTSDDVIISPHKIEVYYVANQEQFRAEEVVRLRMIVLTNSPTDADATKRLGEEILAKLNEGAPFAEMASVYSHGSQAREGGDWGWITRTVLRKDLSDVAFSLKPGEKSGVIETPGAHYILWAEDRKPEHIRPLSEVRNEIEKTLLAQEQDRLQRQWLDRLKKKTFVRYF
jgi:peptidyl-prolyl cis-trans isomerase SurA